MQEISVNDLEQVVSGDKKTIVKFGAGWCTECAILKVKIAGIESDFPEMSFFELDIDNDMSVADKFGINELPVLIAFKKGKEISRWNMGIGDLTGWFKMLEW